MDLRSLRHVVVLARLLSFTKAAEELGLTQSALSRSIQAVEQRAKVRLFDRDRGGVRLTTVGRAFAERAASLLREADDLAALLGRAAGGGEGEAAFGMAPLPAAALLPAVLAQGLSATPDLRSRIAVRSAEALLALLLAERIEFFVSAEGQLPESAPVKSAVLGWFPTSLIVRAGHPLLAPDAAVRPEAFPLIVAASVDQHRPAARGGWLHGPPQVVLEDYGALVRLTETSDAIWLSSTFAVAEELAAGRLAELPWPAEEAGPRFRMMLYSLDRRSLSPAAQRLREAFRGRIRALEGGGPS
jgi:DNA-binding transcriptional LysR family regulator